MSTVLPSDRRELIQFGNDHIDPFSANAAAIGLLPAMAMKFKDDCGAAAEAFNAATAARTQARTATEAFYAACSTFRDTAAGCVRSIKTFAEASADPAAVYNLAAIPAPQTRSHTGQPPAKPMDITAGVEPGGSITLKWKCSNPAGVSRVNYIIQRKLETQTSFTTIDFVGEKAFTDTTLPRGVDSVSYIITGKAGQQTGPASAVFILTFGTVVGGGTTFVTSTDESTGEMKIAA